MMAREKGKIAGKLIATRHMDALGRIVIPRSARDMLNWGESTQLNLYQLDNARGICVVESAPSCSMCKGQPGGLYSCKQGLICLECLEDLLERFGGNQKA